MPSRWILFDETASTVQVRATSAPTAALGLRDVWRAGGHLYRALGRVDGVKGVASWPQALDWLLSRDAVIDEVQLWAHGKWGCALLDRDSLDASAFRPAHPLYGRLLALRSRLGPDALVWLRTCESFGADAGIEFARRMADFLGARVAGHTYVIGFWQSGLHGLRPGCAPAWAADEGLAAGSAQAPSRALWSTWRAPHTIAALTGAVPVAWFDE